jgi:hypothetical protein
MASSRHGRPWRTAGLLVVVLLAVTGTIVLSLASRAPQTPRPPAPAAAPSWSGEPTPTTPATPTPGLSRSRPVEISVARIGLAAQIIPVGLDAAGAIEVPPLEKAQLAGWYELGPSPGEVGNAVVVGHVDSRVMGPAVFFHLGELRPGDLVQIRREDGSTVRFVVNHVESYPKSSFPTDLVYGETKGVGLRLITCGGTFDTSARSYLDNVIVFATLAV